MFKETIQLEILRQKIEDIEYESGSQSDYLDLGKPNKEQARAAKELIGQLNSQSNALKAELQQLISTVRLQNMQAIREWINYHVEILEKIPTENTADVNIAVRKNLARNTIKEWGRVRAGEQEYVGINWHFLKDYKANIRKMIGSQKS